MSSSQHPCEVVLPSGEEEAEGQSDLEGTTAEASFDSTTSCTGLDLSSQGPRQRSPGWTHRLCKIRSFFPCVVNLIMNLSQACFLWFTQYL